MNKKTINILYVGLIIALILFLIFMIFWLKSESSSCVRNPINYFKDKNPQVKCMCSIDGILLRDISDPIEIDFKPQT